MFLLGDLRFVLCSRDLDIPRAQRIIGFNYPQINEVGKSDHIVNMDRNEIPNGLVTIFRCNEVHVPPFFATGFHMIVDRVWSNCGDKDR